MAPALVTNPGNGGNPTEFDDDVCPIDKAKGKGSEKKKTKIVNYDFVAAPNRNNGRRQISEEFEVPAVRRLVKTTLEDQDVLREHNLFKNTLKMVLIQLI